MFDSVVFMVVFRYIPFESSHEGVTLTLDYAFDDAQLATLARCCMLLLMMFDC